MNLWRRIGERRALRVFRGCAGIPPFPPGGPAAAEEPGRGAAPEKCPLRRESRYGAPLCFELWIGQYVSVPATYSQTWCKNDFRRCPRYVGLVENFTAAVGGEYVS